MSTSEYVLVFVALVLGLAMTDILISLHRLLRARRRVRWDWASPVAAMIVALMILMFWWGQFPKDGPVATMTIGAFLPVFVALVLLFLLAAAVLPDQVPAEGLSLETHYVETAPYFWLLMTALLLWATVLEGVERDAFESVSAFGAFLRGRPVDPVIMALFASLIFVRRRWWHAAVLAVALLGPLSWLSRSLG